MRQKDFQSFKKNAKIQVRHMAHNPYFLRSSPKPKELEAVNKTYLPNSTNKFETFLNSPEGEYKLKFL
jgi:hypothetical protein